MSLLQLLQDSTSAWPDSVFGVGRSPLGCLHHLKLEVNELIDAPGDHVEYADCLLLLLDAYRIAGGTADQLIYTAFAKLEVDKTREWGEPDRNGVVRHIKNEGEI